MRVVAACRRGGTCDIEAQSNEQDTKSLRWAVAVARRPKSRDTKPANTFTRAPTTGTSLQPEVRIYNSC